MITTARSSPFLNPNMLTNLLYDTYPVIPTKVGIHCGAASIAYINIYLYRFRIKCGMTRRIHVIKEREGLK